MPTVDLPQSELELYLGLSQKPDDFDSFWARGLDLINQIDPQLEMIPSAFQIPGVECFDIYFTGVGGARIYGKYLRPRGRKNCPLILEFHGYTGSSGDWADKLNYVGAGFCYAALDCRGQGGKSEDRGGVKGNTLNGHVTRGIEGSPEDLLFYKIFLDTAQFAGLIMSFPEINKEKAGVFGGSQGGALALICASLVPQISKAAVMYPFLCDYRRVWEMDLAQEAYEDLRNWFRMFDPLHKREGEIFHKLSYIDTALFTDRICAEVLIGTGLCDSICPPSTQYAAYNKISTHKKIMVYPDFGHEPLPGFTDAAFLFFGEWLSDNANEVEA